MSYVYWKVTSLWLQLSCFVFLADGSSIKLGDFGVSRVLEGTTEAGRMMPLTSVCFLKYIPLQAAVTIVGTWTPKDEQMGQYPTSFNPFGQLYVNICTGSW